MKNWLPGMLPVNIVIFKIDADPGPDILVLCFCRLYSIRLSISHLIYLPVRYIRRSKAHSSILHFRNHSFPHEPTGCVLGNLGRNFSDRIPHHTMGLCHSLAFFHQIKMVHLLWVGLPAHFKPRGLKSCYMQLDVCGEVHCFYILNEPVFASRVKVVLFYSHRRSFPPFCFQCHFFFL